MRNVLRGTDSVFTTLVRLAYISAGLIGWFAFFTHRTVNDPTVGFWLGASLAVAVGIHEFLQQVRTYMGWRKLQRTNLSPEERDRTKFGFLVNLGFTVILLGCGGFMYWNNFVGGDGLPLWATGLIEAVIVPLFGIAATFLLDVEDDPGLLLKKQEHSMLLKLVNMTQKQWDARVQNAVQNGHNLAPIAIALMDDSGDADGARRVRIIEEGLKATENGVFKSGKLYVAPSLKSRVFGADSLNTQIEHPRTVQNDTSSGVQNEQRKPRKVIHIAPSKRAERYVQKYPNASVSEVMKGARVSRGTAYNAIEAFKNERTGTEG